MTAQEDINVAVIGTSNIGAVKYAQTRIEAAYPQLAVTCYGLPGGKFDGAQLIDNHFGPDRADTAAMKLARRINGAPTLDLSRFAHILVIGDTLGLPATLWTALSYDIADWSTRTGRDLLSLPALQATAEEAIAARADHLRAQFGTFELHVAHAPYPTTAVVPKGVHHQQPYAAMATYPHAAALQTLHRHALTLALADRGMTLIPQPDETIAQPFLTKEPYGHGSMDFRNQDNLLNDHRHMNADFGASLFNAFAIAIGAAP
ncbi:hypothetical protein [Gymnodinialimonas ceratoperidinii]|uniref:Uncharacterized protein n=1 Tax=Gymnodinialimonas ceratoperidinii TaxID=2856823 RepID=A0A8F6TX30_9RHOB|nr:hypothetical protein [Gymnodinialimonas ceratoperidinii]QXT39301.1 hypothetical protein KYE46_15450 [Gymnodinialimonas ceratoperidinii]